MTLGINDTQPNNTSIMLSVVMITFVAPFFFSVTDQGEGFIKSALGVDVLAFFSSSLMAKQDKLECLFCKVFSGPG
jgi:hypothetical protein